MTDFDQVVERRKLLKGAFALGATAFVASSVPFAKRAFAHGGINFTPVPANGLDTITVPDGFSWHTVAAWGDPLWSGVPEFNQRTRGTGESQEGSFGDNNDGMALFDINGHSVLAVNNEYCNRKIIYGNRKSGLPENKDDVRKGIASHGVSVFEIEKKGTKWGIKKDSPFNRKITADTSMEITGPARGHALLKTEEDPTGTTSKGTWNNCGNGRTPWGTYLACEENFNGYFSAPSNVNASLSAEHKRYGIKTKDWGYNWVRNQERFDVNKHPNEPHRAGYIVEIDPSNPTSTPRKHTAMGRFKHENVEVTIAKNGHVVAYMGDDERGEFLYKFVSKGKYVNGSSTNADLLTEGDLFVAVFSDNGRGKWVNLKESGMSEAETKVFSRVAASKVGATTMDRPEWVASNPHKVEAYCCLTNNKHRGNKTSQPVNAVNPRVGNKYGQIVRWTPDGSDHTATGFRWDLFVVAGNPTVHSDDRAGSSNINSSNMFNSPDGLAFDSMGNLWIQTDGKYSDKDDFEGMGNNQMLLANPDTGEIKRFLVGPKECEVTGITWSTDKKTMFVGIQHPGEKNPEKCHFPDGGNSVPRSAIVAVTRNDGGLIG